MTAPDRHDSVTISIHWLMAALLIGLWAVGLAMDELPKGELRAQVFGLHKSFGVLALALVVVRLSWRLTHRAPTLPATMPNWEQAAAHLGHAVLYGLMIALPLSGAIMSQAGGREVSLFGLVLPTLVQPNHDLKEAFEEVHEILAWILAVIVGGHVLAALRHQLLLADGVLSRMLPGGK